MSALFIDPFPFSLHRRHGQLADPGRRCQRLLRQELGVLWIRGSFGSGDGQFSAPIGVAIDSLDYVYVVDMFNTRVQKFDSSGNFIQKFGTGGMGNGGFGWPVGIAINATGQIAVSDYRGCLIQEFNPVPPSY